MSDYNTIDKVFEIVKYFSTIDYSTTNPECEDVVRNICLLEDAARSDASLDWESDLVKDMSKMTRKLYSNWEFAIERQQALQVIYKQKEGFWDNPQLARTYEYAKEEGKTAMVNQYSKLLFVGSGWVPESAIAHAKVHGCKVTCIDSNPDTIWISEKLINELGLEDQVEIIHADGKEVEYKEYSHIAIAIMALPKREILRKIKQSASRETVIICRSVTGNKQLIYTPVTQEDLNGFEIVGNLKAKDETTIISSLILNNG